MKIIQILKNYREFAQSLRTLRAHCDIPCGIYDPHAAQIAALTVVRMNQLINDLPKPAATSGKEFETYVHKLLRYTETKEKHAELCKAEIRIIWGDFFKPEHLKDSPELHQVTWDIMKLASKNRQEIDLKVSEDLLAKVQQFAEIFWKAKGVKTKKQPSNQAAKGELVYPVA
jgi:nickel superoxide dismutase